MSSFFSSVPPSPVRDQRSILPLEPVLVSPYNYKSYPVLSVHPVDSGSFRNRNAAHNVTMSQPTSHDSTLFPGANGLASSSSGHQSPHRSPAGSPPSSSRTAYRSSTGTAHRVSAPTGGHNSGSDLQQPLTQRALVAEFPPQRPPSGLRAQLCALAPRAPRCSRRCLLDVLLAFFPFLRIMRTYSLSHDLPCDLAAGFTVFVMQIPQGMAYGMLSGLPPVYGLYVSLFPAIVYFFLGTSKQMSIGALTLSLSLSIFVFFVQHTHSRESSRARIAVHSSRLFAYSLTRLLVRNVRDH